MIVAAKLPTHNTSEVFLVGLSPMVKVFEVVMTDVVAFLLRVGAQTVFDPEV